ncbi:MAG TPA: DMT family transporter [bacterium]|nr:DMT family transporter [bacterium]
MNARTKNIYLLIVSNIFYGFLPVTVKLANGLHYSAIEEAFFRFSFAVLGVAILWAAGLQSISLVNWQALFWRGFFGGLSIFGYFIALQTTSSGKGTLLNYTYILWTNVFAVLFFAHKPPKHFFWYLLLAALGIELVLDVQWNHLNLGDLAGLFSGITGGAAVLAIQRSRRTDTALSVFTSFTLFGFVLSGAALLWGGTIGSPVNNLNQWTAPDFQGFFILLGVGASAMIAQMLFSEAIGHISLALGTLLTLSVPVLAALFGWSFLKEPLTPHFVTGMILVLIACGMMIWRDNQTSA